MTGCSKGLFCFLFMVLFLVPTGSVRAADEKQTPALYTLTIGSLDSTRVDLSLDLPEDSKADRLNLVNIPGRDQRRKYVENLHCEGQGPLREDSRGWILPARCRRITWKARIQRVGKGGYDISRQQAMSDPGRRWIFLPGAALFLKAENSRSPCALKLEFPAGLKSYHRLQPLKDGTFVLPSDYRMGLVMIGLGDFQERTVDAEGFVARHLFDREPRFNIENLARAHRQALDYLCGILRTPSPPAIDVFWFSRKALFARVGGASGYRSIAVNYIDNPQKPLHVQFPLAILLHEQFHMLSDQGPLWLQESLAQYYGLKALLKGNIIDQETYLEMMKKMTRGARDDRTFVQLQKEYDDTGDFALYPIFYSKGCSFWHAVDQQIAKHSNGEKSLDDAVSDLLKLAYSPRGAPPVEFRTILVKLGGEPAGQLSDEQIGEYRKDFPPR